MSDPDPKHWLADDPGFLSSIDDLDTGQPPVAETAGASADVPAQPSPAAAPGSADRAPSPLSFVSPNAPLFVPPPAPPAVSRAPARVINAAHALDPAHLLDTPGATPLPPPARAAASSPESPFSTLMFPRPSPGEPRTPRPLLELFPPEALEPEPPPLEPDRPPLAAKQPLLEAERPAPLPPPPVHAASAPLAVAPRAALQSAAAAAPPREVATDETFYGLREKPFSPSTDPRFHYQSEAHERAGHELLGAIRKRGGPAVLIGPLGMGKTTLCRSLALVLDRRTVVSLALDPLRSIDDLLKTLLIDFGVVSRADLDAAPHLTRDVLASTLGAFLDSLVPLQASAVVFIDDAHDLPVEVLGDLAAILGGDGPASRILQVVLVGQPSLTALLKHSSLRGLDASVGRRTALGPLAADEIAGYLRHRLSIAGASTRVEFADDAIAALFTLSAGSPRVINLLCDGAMTRGRVASAGVIDAAFIAAAAGDLGLEPPRQRAGLLLSLSIAAGFALLMLAGAAAALYVSRDAVNRTILQWENVPLPPGGPVRRLPVPIAPIPPPADAAENAPPRSSL